MEKNLDWCFNLRNGLRFIQPNERISNSYLSMAKASLKRAERDIEESDVLWSTVSLYYAEYYALCSYLSRIGIKSENHTCSIMLAKKLLENKLILVIGRHKQKRENAQYYLKMESKENIEKMIIEAKEIVNFFYGLLINISEQQIQNQRKKVEELLKQESENPS